MVSRKINIVDVITSLLNPNFFITGFGFPLLTDATKRGNAGNAIEAVASTRVHNIIFNCCQSTSPRPTDMLEQVNHLLLEERICMASTLEPSRSRNFPSMKKIIGTLGQKSRSVEIELGELEPKL